MSILGTLSKQPAEVRRATVDFTAFLTTGETVSMASVACSGSGLAASISNAMPDTNVTLLISGGTDGETYTVTLTTDITDGQRIESELIVPVEEISP